MSKGIQQHRVLVLLGSPRRNGNSAIIAREIAAGAKAMGAEVDSLFIQEMDINACRACWACQKPESKGCPINDDMQKVYQKLIKSDSWVIATPVHWFNMSTQTKLWLDRCFALSKYGDKAYDKRIAIALSFADPDPYLSGAVNAIRSFQDSFRYVGAEISGIVYGSATEIGDIEKKETVLAAAKELGKKLVGE